MLYQESDLDVIVGGERTVAEGLGAQWVDGQGIKATRRAGVDGVWNLPKDMALPFPFTVEQFRDFCDWHPTFEWEAIQGPYTNDDGTLDDAALSELAERGTDAAELVRHMLGGLGDNADSDLVTPERPTTTSHTGLDAGSVKKLPAWLDVTGNYIAGIMKDRQIVSAKLLYRELETKAGPESPFDRGTGQNRGSLYVREIAAPVSLKTMQNNWKLLQSLS
jgi:hypothetical protein